MAALCIMCYEECMDKWKEELESEVIRNAYERYLERLEAISTIYSVVLYSDEKIRFGGELINEDEKIRLSNDFSDGYTTIKSKTDIERSSVTGTLHQLNCTQAIIAVVANFENLIDELVSIFSIPGSAIKNAKVETFYGEIPNSTVLKKFAAIHEHLGIKSNGIRESELTTYYKYTLIRNRLVHQQGRLKQDDHDKIGFWAVNDLLHFDNKAVDSIIHFFLLPIVSFVRELSSVHVEKTPNQKSR